jgi:hypothetical protein
MPTIIKLDIKKLDDILFLLNKTKSGNSLSREDLVTLQPCINNSMVGLSKLLHFINPAKYAIWDSRIYRYLTELKSSYGVSKPELYLAYLSGLWEISATEGYAEIHQSIEKHFNYQITPMRAIEVVMFEADKKTQP